MLFSFRLTDIMLLLVGHMALRSPFQSNTGVDSRRGRPSWWISAATSVMASVFTLRNGSFNAQSGTDLGTSVSNPNRRQSRFPLAYLAPTGTVAVVVVSVSSPAYADRAAGLLAGESRFFVMDLRADCTAADESYHPAHNYPQVLPLHVDCAILPRIPHGPRLVALGSCCGSGLVSLCRAVASLHGAAGRALSGNVLCPLSRLPRFGSVHLFSRLSSARLRASDLAV